MKRNTINHIASAGIIYPKNDPTKIFLEIKDKTYPIKKFRHSLCLIGGNWIGKAAKKDQSPSSTFNREVEEELSFRKPLVSSTELKLLGIKNSKDYQIKKLKHKPDSKDIKSLRSIKTIIKKSKKPWGDFIHTINQKEILLSNFIGQNKNLVFVNSYWLIPLKEKDWAILENLQKKFGNLSEESQTVIISIDDILKNKIQIIWGHDHILKKFFLKNKINSANRLSIFKNIQSKNLGKTLKSYKEYKKKFTILRNPFLDKNLA
ncbi:MAG: hypothetical protein WCX12_02710 [Candidatus Paceibacterota bacterium]|jgi:hypothetical protein